MQKSQSIDQRAERPLEPKFSSIHQQAERINHSLNVLDGIMHTLYDNLSPVLKEERPMQATVAETVPSPESSLASKLCVSADELEAVCRRLNTLIGRLDI